MNNAIFKNSIIIFCGFALINACLTVDAKQPLKIEVYWGETPENAANEYVVSTRREANNKLQTLFVEEGETISLTKTKTVKVIKSMAGEKQTLQSKEDDIEAIDSEVIKELTNDAKSIVQKNNEIENLMKSIRNKEQEIINVTLGNQVGDLAALNAQLKNMQNNKDTAMQELHVELAKQQALQSNNVGKTRKRSNYAASTGAVQEECMDLPEGVSLKTKVIDNNQFSVEVNIINSVEGSRKSKLIGTTQQLHTTLRVGLDKWQQICGNGIINDSSVQNIATSREKPEQSMWIRINFQ